MSWDLALSLRGPVCCFSCQFEHLLKGCWRLNHHLKLTKYIQILVELYNLIRFSKASVVNVRLQTLSQPFKRQCFVWSLEALEIWYPVRCGSVHQSWNRPWTIGGRICFRQLGIGLAAVGCKKKPKQDETGRLACHVSSVSRTVSRTVSKCFQFLSLKSPDVTSAPSNHHPITIQNIEVLATTYMRSPWETAAGLNAPREFGPTSRRWLRKCQLSSLAQHQPARINQPKMGCHCFTIQWLGGSQGARGIHIPY